jgi:lipoyl(octanoyl) transferase
MQRCHLTILILPKIPPLFHHTALLSQCTPPPFDFANPTRTNPVIFLCVKSSTTTTSVMMMKSSVNGYSQYHESRIEGDYVGNLTRGCIISRLKVMRSQEQSTYSYRNYEPPMFPPYPSTSSRYNVDESIPHINSSWREKICLWSFSVVDHFDLSRDVVAVSMSLFDRFLATRGNRCNGSTARLASLAVLHIAIKVNEVRRIKLGTLANFSRGQFGPRDIEEMEWDVLTSLDWKIHPPTSMSFVSHLLLLLPPQIDDACKEEIYSLSRYITELSVCDSAFVEVNPSSVAFAAILISLEDPNHRKFISSSVRDEFMRSVERHAELYRDNEQLQ